MARARMLVACALGVLAASSAWSGAASSNAVVSVTIASASWVDATGCAPNLPGRTSFGSVLPGASVVTSADCDVEFGSSNDTASLMTWQTDGTGTAMARPTTTWTSRASGTAQDLNDVEAVKGTSVAWVSANGGEVLRTTNNGAAWTRFTSAQTGVGGWLYGLAAPDANAAWAVGGGGTIIRTTNAGAAWTNQSVGGGSLFDADALDANTAWAVGSGGRILRTTNGGATWTAQASGTVEDLNEVDVVDASTVWIGGYNGTLLRTMDGGATWTQRPVPGVGSNYRAVAALDANRVWIGDSGADIQYSTNGGTSWTRVLDRNGGVTNIYSIDVVDDATVFSVAANVGAIDRSFNSGTNFTDETPGGAPALYAIAASDSLTGYAVGFGGAIYTSNSAAIPDFVNNGTADWDTAGSLNLFGACLRDADLGAAGGGGGWIEDTNTGSDCADGDSDPWNAIPAGAPGVKIASIAAPDAEAGATDPVAHLRFGFRAKDDQPAGRYLAPITFQVVAPAV